MMIFLYIAALIYAILLILLRIGLTRIRKETSDHQPFVSVIIAARNEENHIGACIDSVLKQTYPKQCMELIVVDDRSEDGTASIVLLKAEEDSRVRLVRVREPNSDMAPKKQALDRGIRQASGEILFFTDADTRPESRWIEQIVRCFSPDVGLVAGYSPFTAATPRSLLDRLTVLDALALAAVAAGTFGLDMPLTCSGRNLAYRKTVWDEISGFSGTGRFVSGDDDLLLHRIRRLTRWKMRYSLEPGSHVPTYPPRSVREFIAQRTRHASKGFHYPAGLVTGLIGLYLFNAALLASACLPSRSAALAGVFLIKAGFEWLLVEKMAAVTGQRRLLAIFPLAMFLHIPYVVIFGLWGQIGRFNWKGSAYSKKINHAENG
jgi:biofilm PGA synthesis N-glycosyltransferase PgaC